MIQIVVNMYVKEEFRDRFLSLAKEVVKATNEKDKGCVKYELCSDIQNPLHFVMLEEWESLDAQGEHMKSEHSARIIPELNSCCSREADVVLLEKAF